jgi:ABC-type taurine transport system ATPase subunit
MLLFEGVYKTFSSGDKRVEALEDINMQVEQSEFAVIVGPSGCEKSTLLQIAAGLEHPTAGKAFLNDTEITGPGADRGMVFQANAVSLAQCGRQRAFGPRQKKMPEQEVQGGSIAIWK